MEVARRRQGGGEAARSRGRGGEEARTRRRGGEEAANPNPNPATPSESSSRRAAGRRWFHFRPAEMSAKGRWDRILAQVTFFNDVPCPLAQIACASWSAGGL